MALLPSLTTSNRVTGSPPSPLCWATPLALPRPRATLTTLSAGDFRGFLLADCGVNRDVVGENKGAKKKKNSEKGRRENQSCNRKQTLPIVTRQAGILKKQTRTYQGLFPRPASLLLASHLCVVQLTHVHAQAHRVGRSRLVGRVPGGRMRDAASTHKAFQPLVKRSRFHSLQHGKLRRDHPADLGLRRVAREPVLFTRSGRERSCGPKMKMQVVAGGLRWEGSGGTGRRKERRRRKRGGQDPGRTTLNSQALNSRRLLGEGNTKKIPRGKEEKHLTKVGVKHKNHSESSEKDNRAHRRKPHQSRETTVELQIHSTY